MGKTATVTEKAAEAAIAGLDFLVRNQNTDEMSADYGRYPFTYDCRECQTLVGTTSWTTGTCTDALLVGYRFTGDQKYLDAAGRGIEYIKTLQNFDAFSRNADGAIRENTPRCRGGHPRDALTAAWAMLDYARQIGRHDTLYRAMRFADWFVEHAMAEGYPYWTVSFYRGQPKRDWCGSFHSGSAFFMYTMYLVTGGQKYRQAMKTILDYFNTHCLMSDGRINVIIDRDSGEVLDGSDQVASVHEGWQMMHRYNDDFGCLANLAASTIEPDGSYRQAAERFLRRMVSTQRADGGFGPPEWSVPSGGGCVLLELMASRNCGLEIATDEVIEAAVDYLISTQFRSDTAADGAFLGFNGPNDYELSPHIANARTAGYAIMGLLRAAGAVDPFYFVA